MTPEKLKEIVESGALCGLHDRQVSLLVELWKCVQTWRFGTKVEQGIAEDDMVAIDNKLVLL